MHKLVLIRHGESIWNKRDIFTGWCDIGLSRDGKKEAKRAAELLKGSSFDIAFSSILKRSLQSLEIILKKLNLKIPIITSWKLNERHYGSLQGEKKNEIKKKFGKERFFKWRRSYDVRPPALNENNLNKEKIFKGIHVPLTESLKDVEERVIPFFKEAILPEIKKGKNVLILSHGSTMRVFLKYFLNISSKDVEHVNVPTGFPLIFEFNDRIELVKYYYLGDEGQVKEATQKVKEQGSV